MRHGREVLVEEGVGGHVRFFRTGISYTVFAGKNRRVAIGRSGDAGLFSEGKSGRQRNALTKRRTQGDQYPSIFYPKDRGILNKSAMGRKAEKHKGGPGRKINTAGPAFQ